MVDENGRFIGEEYTLALAAWHVLQDAQGHVGSEPVHLAHDRRRRPAAGVPVVRTPVGEANVVEAMFAHECIFGGEGNGGVIDPRVVPVRDSLVGIGHILQLLAEEEQPLSRLVASLPAYAMIKRKAPLQRERLNDVYKSLKQHFAGGQFNLSDGLRIDLPEGWLHIRPSNTEPIVRIISEAEGVAAAETLADAAGSILQSAASAR